MKISKFCYFFDKFLSFFTAKLGQTPADTGNGFGSRERARVIGLSPNTKSRITKY